MSNVVPGTIAELVSAVRQGNLTRGTELAEVLSPLFKIVTVKTEEQYEGFTVPCKFRNPSAVKTLMNGLGLPAGPCRPPLGQMSDKGRDIVRTAARTIFQRDRNIFIPLEDFYGVNVEERIDNDEYWG
jgi:4-hydroxy-tetrahydrodipicolinate synthase